MNTRRIKMKTDNEKYNEQVQPNTAFLNGLKAKLPEFSLKMDRLISINSEDN